MTLNTEIYIHGEIGALDIFNFLVHQLLEFDTDHRDFAAIRTKAAQNQDGAPSPTWTMQTVIGQGLPAWTMVHYRPGGAYRTETEAAAHDTDICNVPESEFFDADDPVCDGSHHDPACHLQIDMDTGYGFRGPNGMRCDHLHGVIIARLGVLLDERAAPWSWRNEYTGEVHQGATGLDGLLRAGEAGNAWFDNVAFPAIAARTARNNEEH